MGDSGCFRFFFLREREKVREEEYWEDLRDIGEGINMIKISCIKFNKNNLNKNHSTVYKLLVKYITFLRIYKFRFKSLPTLTVSF